MEVAKRVCVNCGSEMVTAYAGKNALPLCTECWHKLYEDKLTLEEIEKAAEKNE